jgi:ABC-2 type transport system ATP-binding protein
MTDTIAAFDLVKCYRGHSRPALDGPSFNAEEGEVFGLVGPTGAGKTTAIEILATRIMPTTGRALVCGIDVVTAPVRARRVLALVPQRPNLDCALTARQNLIFHAAYHCMPPRSRARRADELLESVGMTGHADASVRRLTADQTLRLTLARELMHRPRVLFLDEPSVGLDPRSRAFLHGLVDELRTDGVTVLLATQDPSLAARLCDHVAILDEGRLVASGSPEALTRRPPEARTATVTMDMCGAAESEVLTILSRAEAVTAVVRMAPAGPPAVFRLTCADDPARLLPAVLEVLEYLGVRTLAAECHTATLDDIVLDMTGPEPV